MPYSNEFAGVYLHSILLLKCKIESKTNIVNENIFDQMSQIHIIFCIFSLYLHFNGD